MIHRYLQEYTALGTAGGIYHFRDQILTGNPEMFFVINADVCGDFPLIDMLEFHRSRGSNACGTILATEVMQRLLILIFNKYSTVFSSGLQVSSFPPDFSFF